MWLTDELLLHYQRCQRRAFLNLYGDLSQQSPPSDFLLKLQRDSQVHRQNVLGDQIYDRPQYPRQDWLSGAKGTLDLMHKGVDYIYQGVLLAPADDFSLPVDSGWSWAHQNAEFSAINEQSDHPKPFPSLDNGIPQNPQYSGIMLVSKPHLLVKQSGQSKFGNWNYIPSEIKFGKRPKAEYQILVAFHAQVLAAVQGVWPETAQLILRSKKLSALNLKKWVPQMQAILEECIQTLLSPQVPQEPEVFISRQQCSFCRWYNYCYAHAKSHQHLSLLPGVTLSRYRQLQYLGLTTAQSLAVALPSQLEPVFGEQVAAGLVRQAQSVLQNRAILIPNREGERQSPPGERWITNGKSEAGKFILHPAIDNNFLPTSSVELYFDIEAEPELNLDYLLGVLVIDRLAQTQTFHPLLAEQPAEEELIWQQFLTLVGNYPNAPIFHFSPYEADTVKRLSKLYKTPVSQVLPLLSRFVDIHNRIMGAVTLPVESYSLKSIASWRGFKWRDPQASGSQSIFWYDRWLKTSDRTCLNAIICYNEDDCRATYHVKDWLASFLQGEHEG